MASNRAEPFASDMPQGKSFINHTIVYGLGALSLRLLSMCLLPIHTRYLSSMDFGLLQVLLQTGEVVNTCLMFQGIGLATLNIYRTSDDPDRHIAQSSAVFLCGVILFGGLATALAAAPIAHLPGLHGRERLLAGGVLCVMASGCTIMPLTLMQARLESRNYVMSTIAIVVIRITLTLLLVVL